MNYIFRNTDVILNNKDLEELYTFENFPVFMGCTNDSSNTDIKAKMSWSISKSSGIIQLNPLLPLEVVYGNGHGSGTVGKIWNEHHQAFAKFISKFNPSIILEIGGLHGVLANKYLSIDKDINWTIIEPNPIIEDELPVDVIKGFFDEKFSSEKEFDTIIHSHVLEHIYDPKEFFDNKSKLMKVGNKLIFSVPNMKVMLENNYNNCINFEHTLYLRSEYIEYFLKTYGFKMIEKEYFRNDHSIFYCAEKVDYEVNAKLNFDKLYSENRETFSKYIQSHLKEVSELNKKIEDTDMPIYLFGAHIFAQYLIQFGLETNKIKYVLDNDIQKHGKRLYGTDLIVKSPKILEQERNALVILKAGVYNKEVREDIIKNINSNIIFL